MISEVKTFIFAIRFSKNQTNGKHSRPTVLFFT
nr:MAG TPA: hypothetical protein [Caudoviricetes sp.]